MLINIKAALAARHMRQADLALELDIAPSALSEIINGRRALTPDLGMRIAQILRADPAWLAFPLSTIPELAAGEPVGTAAAECVA